MTTSSSGPILAPSAVLALGEDLLQAVGTPRDLASVVAQSLVDADVAGVNSHGVMRLPRYVQAALSGKVQPSARPHLAWRHGAVAHVDGRSGWGQPAAQLAVEHVLELASDNGVGTVTVARCNHIGRLGDYLERIAAKHMVGIAMCNSLASVAAFGGRTRVLGTNPVGFAVPNGGSDVPLLVDFATAAIAEGRLSIAAATDERIPPDSILDKNGQPTTDPKDYYQGGVLLPFGRHKGYGLAVMVEAIAGILSGAGASALPEYDGGNGTILIALEISAFIPLQRFLRQSQQLSELVTRSQPAQGFANVLLPGEPEAAARTRAHAEGIRIPLAVWDEINSTAARLGVAAPSTTAE